MKLARTAVESVTIGIEASFDVPQPPEVAAGLGTASPGPEAEWVEAPWVTPGAEATLQIAGPDAPQSSALRMLGIGHNYLWVRFGTVIRKAPEAIEVR